MCLCMRLCVYVIVRVFVYAIAYVFVYAIAYVFVYVLVHDALELNNVTYAQPHIGVCTHYTNLCLSTSLHALSAVSYFHTAFVR